VPDSKDKGADPFAVLRDQVGAPGNAQSKAAKAAVAEGEFLSPPPAGMPPQPAQHFKKGKPSRVWTYRDALGHPLFFVMRFDEPAAPGEKPDKTFAQLTPWRMGDVLQWRWKGPVDPRPLYGLDRLAAKPSAPVLVVEGEKAADAAAELFPGFAVAAWCGGTNSVSKADWSPLAGRRVAILPDADEPGLKAAKAVRGVLVKLGVAAAGIVYLPDCVPDKWDIADEFPAGFDLAALSALVEDAARPVAAAAAADTTAMEEDSEGWPAGFSMDGGGLWFQPREEGKAPQWVCGPFDVLGEARDQDGNGWSVVIRFKDRDLREKTAICSKAKLATASTDVRRELVDMGLNMPRRSPNSGDPLADCLLRIRSLQRIVLCPSTGWAGMSFVLPGEVISAPGAEPSLFTGEARALRFGQAGTLDGWQSEVAARAIGNSRAVFAISLALAGPLLQLLGHESGGFHLRGNSSCGKSTVAMVAGSVWGGGGPIGFAQSWRSTDNGIELMAQGHSDTILVLDELQQLASEAAGPAAYMLANGQAKARLKSDGTARTRAAWRVLFLSTGEVSLAEHIKAARGGGNVMAGQELRVIDLKADAGRGLGAWEDLQEFDGGAALSDAFKAGVKANYGFAGPAFVRALVERGDELSQAAQAIERRFTTAAVQDGDTGQIHRGAGRFALVAAAGELAIELGLVPWEKGHAFGMALLLFRQWARGFGRQLLREEVASLRRVVDMIQANLSRFGVAEDEAWISDAKASEGKTPSLRAGEARSLTTLGVFWRHDNGEDYYIFHRAGWDEVFKGMDGKAAAKFLKSAGYLLAEDGKTTKKKSVKGQKVNMYWVRAAILQHEFDDDDL